MDESSSFATQLKLAQRIRDNRNWLTLAFLLIGQLPAAVAIVNDVFPQIAPKYVFLISIAVSTFCAQLSFAWATRKLAKPSCTRCGTEWVIIESGPGANSAHFKLGGSCPHCGVEITE